MSFWRATLACIVLACALITFGVGVNILSSIMLTDNQSTWQVAPKLEDPKEKPHYNEWGGNLMSDDCKPNYQTNTITITTPGELAYFNYVVSQNKEDFSGWTVVLEQSIDLASYNDNLGSESVQPWWSPIQAGRDGQNVNIIFDGQGHTISGLKIEIVNQNNNLTDANVGLFGTFVGGAIMNLTLDKPVLRYAYTGRSETAGVLTAPVRVAAGLVAGRADGTYFSNININEPTFEIETNNPNGHSFYVGGAVGRLSYSPDTVSYREVNITEEEYRWGVDTINITGGHIDFTVTNGTDSESTYGTATYGYVGGLVGANYSSKIINSTLTDLSIRPTMSGVGGNYYAGGLVGLTMLRTNLEIEEDGGKFVPKKGVVISGLLNNLLINTNVANSSANLNGIFAGCSANSWNLSNVYIGNSSLKFIGAQYNDFYFSFNRDDCIGMTDYEALFDGSNSNEYFKKPGECNSIMMNSPLVAYCGADDNHTIILPSTLIDNFSTYTSTTNNYNKQYTTISDFVNDSDFFNKLNDYTNTNGNLYKMAERIVCWEYNNQMTGDNDQDNLRAAANQFRKWDQTGSGNNVKVSFGKALGYKYKITYHANALVNPDSENPVETGDAGWDWTTASVDYQTYNPTLVVGYCLGMPITAPEDPKRIGYTFEGWGISRNFDGEQYEFGQIMQGDEIHLYARWKVKQHTLKFYLAEGVPVIFKATSSYAGFGCEWSPIYGAEMPNNLIEKIAMNSAEIEKNLDAIIDSKYLTNADVIKAKERSRTEAYDVIRKLLYGRTFTGDWYYYETYTYEDADGNMIENKVQTTWNKKVPDDDIELYAIWQDDYDALRNLLSSEEVRKINNEYRTYYTKNSWATFNGIYTQAENALRSDQPVNASEWIEKLNSAISGLRVDGSEMRELPPLSWLNDPRNLYPFEYNCQAYQAYKDVRDLVLNYLNVDLRDDATAADINKYLSYRSDLMRTWDALNMTENRNTRLGVDTAKIKVVEEMYITINSAINGYDQNKYTPETWADFERAVARYQTAFNTKSDPYMDDLLKAINDYQDAEKQLKVKVQDTDAGQDSLVPQMPIPPVLLGFLVVLVLALGVGGFITFDIFRHKYIKPKMDHKEQVEEAAVEDTYL